MGGDGDECVSDEFLNIGGEVFLWGGQLLFVEFD